MLIFIVLLQYRPLYVVLKAADVGRIFVCFFIIETSHDMWSVLAAVDAL